VTPTARPPTRLVGGLERWHAAILLAVPALALAVLGRGPALPEAVAALAGIALSGYLRTRPDAWASDLWAIPALLVVGGLTLLAVASLLAELLAGASALAAIYWIASDLPGLRLPVRPADGLWLPGLAVGLAVAVTLFLPAGPALVGVASAILVGLFFGLAAVLGGWSSPAGAP